MKSEINLGERLRELIVDEKIERIDDFCAAVGLGRTDFYRWLNNTTVPSYENIVKLADAFHCTIDFLIGRVEENHLSSTKAVPHFGDRLRFLMPLFNTNPHKLSKDANISRASIYEWLNSKTVVSLYSLVKLADIFGCSIDYLIGRIS